MRKLLLSLSLLAAAMAPAAVGAAPSTTIKVGYTTGELTLGLGAYATFTVRGAMELPVAQTSRLAGARITAVRLALAADLSQQDNYITLSDALTGQPRYKQRVPQLSKGWNLITLDTPYEVTGQEPVFVGFRYRSFSESLSMDGSADNDLANWISTSSSDAAEPDDWAHQPGGCFNLQVIAEGEGLPQDDAALDRLFVKGYAATGAPMPLTLVVRNQGAATITSLGVTAAVEDEEPASYVLEGLSIPTGDRAVVTANDVVFPTRGVANLDVTITAVNGSQDLWPQDNAVHVPDVIIKNEYVNRRVLVEMFSTQSCNNCPAAHRTIGTSMTYRHDLVPVTHHAGNGSDQFSIAADEEYCWFYRFQGRGSQYSPGAMLDRTNMSAYGADDGNSATPAPVFFPQQATFDALADQALSTPALVSVDITRTYDAATRRLTVGVSGRAGAGDPSRLKATAPAVTVYVTEDGIVGAQAGVDDMAHYVHDHVVRAIPTDIWGDAVDFDAQGGYATPTYTVDVPAGSDPDKMNVIAFISNRDRTNPNACQVYNTAMVPLRGGSTAIDGIVADGADGADALRVTVLQGALAVEGADWTAATLVSLSGAAVARWDAQCALLPTTGVAPGVYVLALETPRGPRSAKVAIR